MKVLLTGVAGFIGMHAATALLMRGVEVVGVDSLNGYYDPALKHDRLRQLQGKPGFAFHHLDLSQEACLPELTQAGEGVTHILHLAAQAGVRYSLDAPLSFIDSNLRATTVLLEWARTHPVAHFVYASSSSVYGNSPQVPFREDNPADAPLSIYAASKRGTEHLAAAYAHLYGQPCTGLRFFTVYGPWGRPDMAYFHFARAMMRGTPIQLFDEGTLVRDYTYIDDIIGGVLSALEKPATGHPPHVVYNLGNHHPETTLSLVSALEKALDRKAEVQYAPMQPGDAALTYADIGKARQNLGFEPQTTLEQGIARFAQWFLVHGSPYR